MLRRLITAALSVLVLLPMLVALPASAGPRVTGRAGTVWHVVRPGETLSYIGALHGLGAAQIAAWNQLPVNAPIQIDATLRLTPPETPLPEFRTHIETITPATVNWNPKKRCPVAPANLRRVWVSYIDFNGAYHDGSVIVRKDVAARAQQIFRTLYGWRFRIMGMAPMRINNPGETNMATVTAAYNCRAVAGTKVWSEHATGTAIDINPFQNPMIRGRSLSPANSSFYLDRTRYLIGMVHPEGAARAFTWNDFHWGGTWTSLKDYMHFSLTNR